MRLKKIARLSFMLMSVACICVYTSITFAEDNITDGGTIRGKALKYGKATEPIEGLIVTIVNADGKEHTIKTDVNGNYKFDHLPVGKYTLKYSQEGFESKGSGSQSIVVEDDGDHVVELKMVDWFNHAKQMVHGRILPMLYQVTDNISSRHNLDKSVVNALRQSIRESIEAALENRKDLSIFAIHYGDENIDVFDALLLRPDIKGAFAKHLTDTQLKDINDFSKVRRHRRNQASIYYSTAVLDKTLSFTADQRQEIMPLRLSAKDDESWVSVLTDTQKKILNWIKGKNAVAAIKHEIRSTQNQIAFDWSDTKTATARLDELKIKADMLRSHEQTKQLVETIFASHIKQLGTLNDHASQLLTLAIKGVAQKYLEAEEKMTTYREAEAKLIAAARSKEITSYQAYEELQNLSEKLWNEKKSNSIPNETIHGTGLFGFRFFTYFIRLASLRRALLNGPRGFNSEIDIVSTLNHPTYDITYHPLFQLTLKDVLSEDEYAKYIAIQTERDNFRQQALRDLVVADLDILMFLNDIQRKQLEKIATQLSAPLLIQDDERDMFDQLTGQIESGMLTRWQETQLHTLLSDIDEI